MAGRKQTQYTIPLMIIAFLVIGAFGYWLNVSTEAVRVAIAEEEAAAAAAAEAEREATEEDAMPVSAENFGADPRQYLGQLVRLDDVPFFGQVGPAAINVLLDGLIYLVHVPEGISLPAGSEPTVIGTVHQMTDSVLNAWEAMGAFPQPGNRDDASLSETFIEAMIVRVEPAAEAPAPGN